MYSSLQGKVFIANRLSNGRPGALTWAFNVPVFEINPKTTEDEHQESYSGTRSVDDILETKRQVQFKLTLEDFNPTNLALGLYAGKTSIVSGSVVDEAFPAGLAVGDQVMLDHPGASDIVITDSAVAPHTLVEGVDYEVLDALGGLIEIKVTVGRTQPFHAAYDYADGIKLAVMNQQPPERCLVFIGQNTYDGTPVRAIFPRARFSPQSAMGLIDATRGKIELAGQFLFDALNGNDPAFGGFGRIDMTIPDA